MGRPLKWRTLRSLVTWVCREIELQQREHLGVAILLDDIDDIVRGDELVHFAGEGPGAQTRGSRQSSFCTRPSSGRATRARRSPTSRRR